MRVPSAGDSGPAPRETYLEPKLQRIQLNHMKLLFCRPNMGGKSASHPFQPDTYGQTNPKLRKAAKKKEEREKRRKEQAVQQKS